MKKEIIYNFILTLLTSILAFIQNKFFVEYMGLEVLGLMKLFTQFLAYLNIIEMGLWSASTFALYKPLANKDYENVSIIINTVENIYNKIAILLLVLGILCIPILPFFIKISTFGNVIYFYWFLYILNTFFSYVFIKYLILFTANQEFIYIRIVQVVSKIFYQLIQIYCIIKYNSFFIFIIFLIMDTLTQWLFFRIHYKKKYSYITKTKERFKGIKNDIKNLFWHKIGGLVVFNTDLILISKFVSLEIVGVYASYQMIMQMLSSILGILTNVLSPRIGKFIAEHDKIETYYYFRIINIFYCFMATFFTFCTYILVNSFIILWLGEGKYLSNFTLKLICFNFWTFLFRWILEKFKEGCGFFDDIKVPVFESLINFIFSILLVFKLGLNGIIIGTIISNIIIVLIYKPILVFKRCFEKGYEEYMKLYGNYLIIIIFCFISLNLTVKPFIQEQISSWYNWILYAFKISIISLINITIIFLMNNDFRSLLKKLYRK